MTEARTILAQQPDPDRFIAFDLNRRGIVTVAENVETRLVPNSSNWSGSAAAR